MLVGRKTEPGTFSRPLLSAFSFPARARTALLGFDAVRRNSLHTKQEFRAFNDPAGLVTIDKVFLRGVLPDLEAASIWTAEKLEALAVAADGQVYAVTDNDGVDEATGETLFLRFGDWQQALDGRSPRTEPQVQASNPTL